MSDSKRLKEIPAQKRALILKADAYRGQIGGLTTELRERWSDPHAHWWSLAGVAARNLIFSQFSSKWERGLAVLYSTWQSFNR
ncbi:MAG: hypothetical protein ABI222_04000 [Opitutaceae bacterium]